MRNLTIPSRRTRTSCSVLALATVLVVGATPAAAQSFLGSGSFTHNGGGAANITTAPNLTTITVNGGQTVIDWSPTDTTIGGGAINFQPTGTTANFLGSGSYAVLNRINPADSTRSISMNGTIQTLALGAAVAANGSLYFYTPGGFVIGSNAVINVGSLVLSASPITVDGSGQFISGFGTTNGVIFGQATQAGAQIGINSGAQINATGTDAYVAMIAPRVQHNGTINVSGSAALVAAEAATISFSPDGLFDIQVTTGTTDNEGLEINGTVTGSAGGPGDHHRAYLVAVPKNSLLTMAIGSGANLGFAVADSADVVGNTVVLSAGHDINNGAIAGVSAGSTGPGAIANLDVRDSVFTSAMIGEATGTALLSGFGTLKFHSDVTVHADGEIQLSTQLPTGFVDVDGALNLSTQQSAFAGANVTSARVQIVNINGGDINVDGLTTINTDASAGSSGVAGVNGGNATAGSVNINSNPGGSIALLGGLAVTAEGRGGSIFVAGIDAGSGTGGQVIVRSAGDGSALTISGGTSIEARGYGGSGAGGECFSCNGDGGFGQGGDIRIIGQSGVGATVTLSGPVSAIADGIGGTAGTGAIAGTGTGGNADYFVGTGSVMSLTGNLLLQANGTGGLGITSAGGVGIGGRVAIAEQAGATSGTITITGNVELSTDGTGGNSFGSGASGGAGTGGGGSQGAYIFADTAAITIGGTANLHSTGTGGAGFNGTGGAGTGGYARLRSNSSLAITGNATVSADATGGDGIEGGGDATGGDAYAFSTGTMTLAALTATATATGGAVIVTDTDGWLAGDAVGGDVDVYAEGGTLTINGATILSTDATGGSVESEFDVGGNATGGTTRLFANAGGMVSLQSLTATATGTGGGSTEFLSGIGGDGEGGTVRVQGTAATASVMISGAATLDASGKGSSNIGGDGTGGTAEYFAASGSSLTVSGIAQAIANGVGGSYVEMAGNGGIGDGGLAAVYSADGNITFNNDVVLSALATGGSTANGIGGNALGGTARLGTDGGEILVTGTLGINGSATGGTGTSGGNATALISPLADETLPVATSIYVGNGGSVTVEGLATLNGSATGGAGIRGAGGNAVGGEADVVAFIGDLDLGGLSVDVSGRGGVGGTAGGNGGSGQGGAVDLTFGLNAAPINGTITIGGVTLNANGVGGIGGNGQGDIEGVANGNGGNGGAGTGGAILYTGSAAGGTLDINGASILTALGTGGRGGNGAGGEVGVGGNGGAGGVGTGGFIQTGTISNSNSPGTGGGAAYTTLSIDTSAFGGNGGNGGVAGGGSGAGGDGGNAIGGRSQFLARGVPVTADAVTLAANATGGNGGTGSVAGDGGNARTGVLSIESKDRFDTPTQRGSLTVDSIIASAGAFGGTGSTTGTSTVVDGSSFRVFNGDATIGSVAITLSGTLIDSTLGPSFVSIRDGTATIGEFSFLTDGTLSLDANNGSMTAGSIALHAANFVPHVADPAPTAVGTYFANSFDIQTGNNFLTTANLDSVATLTIIAPGAIQAGNITGDADIVLQAQSGEIDIGNILGGGGIDLDANDFVATGNVVGAGLIDVDAGSTIGMGTILNSGNTSLFAGTSINVGAINSGNGAVSLITGTASIFGDVVSAGSIFADSGDDIFLGNLTAPGDIELLAAGNILIGNATAGETIDLDAGGYIDGGNMTAGDSVYAGAGEYIDLLNISAGIVNQSSGYDADYNVGLLAGTTIDTGDIVAFNSIGLGALDDIYTGNIAAGNIFMVLGGGDMSFGTINSGGPTYFANASMIPLGGNPSDGDFNPAPILASDPVASGGSITLRGPATVGSLVAGAGTFFDGGNITADNAIYIDAGTAITLSNLVAGLTDGVISGSAIRLNAGGLIDVSDVTAIGEIDFEANGSITGGNMTSGQGFYAEAEGAITLENISVGLVNPQPLAPDADLGVGILAETSIQVENITSVESVGLATLGSIQAGNITTDGDLIALAGLNMNLGSLDAGGRVYLANASIYVALEDGNEDVSAEDILNTVPVATGGSILVGTIDAGSLQAAAGTTLTGTTVTTNGLLFATSGGTMSLTNLIAGGDVRLTSGGNITTGSIDSGDDIALVASGSISTLDIFAYDDISADAGTTITTDDITGNSIDLFADGNVDTGNLLTQDFFGGQQQLFPGASITVQSGGNIDTGSINSLDGVFLAADGGITTGNITADTFIETISGGSQGLGNLTAGDFVELDAEGGITFGVANAESVDFTSGGAVTGGNITAISYATGEAEGAVVLGNILTTGAAPIDDFSIGFSSATSIVVGNATGTDRVGFATLGDLTTGNINAGRLFMALVGGDMVTGSITTAANGRVYIADSSMFETGGGLEDDFDSDIVLALAPVASGGSVTINGAVSTGRVQIAAGDDLSTRAITANRIEASAGDNATLDGMWRAGQVSLRSGDINITANGGIDAGTNGTILLNAVNTDGPALIGDGLTGSGYALSNAEFGRISGGTITIAVGGFGGDADTLIGDLSITGPLAGSNIESSTGGVEFATLQEDGAALDGTLRIVGDVVATGFGAENYLGFYTQNFELDAATGSISITSSGSALAGILELYASRIHVAEGTLLDQLAANPQFAGYREALNRPATVARPEGVINAASFEIEFGGSDITGPYTLFVQNLGTTAVPAGFLLNAANISDDSDADLALGSLDMAINGQIIGEGGTLTGIAVRDLLVTEFGTGIFAAGSTINGCPLVGACLNATPPRIDTIVRTDVQINDPTGLGDGVDGSLTNPPNPLLDTDFLGQSGDVDDPVSGAGNPSLMGTSDEEIETCDSDKDSKCKPAKEGDGK